MNIANPLLVAQQPDVRVDQILKLAIFAVGGQGGGVLNSWIVALAERHGYDAQATSVAGVAQRTGSTIYYVEMLAPSGDAPVFSLAPSEGDVDILIASELMEAGRAITRGFITPGKTKVIASSHRQYATLEKVTPGDGRADNAQVLDALADQAGEVVAFDMQTIAEEEGTVISATLFGALCGSGALPFDVEAFRETIRASGRGVERSLAAFERGREEAARAPELAPASSPAPSAAPRKLKGPDRLLDKLAPLTNRVGQMPTAVQDMVQAGLCKTVDFQDVAYGVDYLDRVERVLEMDSAEYGYALTLAAAKHVANAMAYDDIIRVADAKTRPGRFDRIGAEVGATDRHLVQVTEYTHPGAAEVISMMPARLGRWVQGRPALVRFIDRRVNKGRHIRTDSLWGFLSLYLVSSLRPWRRALLRHGQEMIHLEVWLKTALDRVVSDYDAAVQTLNARRLVKGYSDTHTRGLTKFDKVLCGAALVEGREDAADWIRRLIDAALADPDGSQLDGALQTITSFAAPPELPDGQP